MKIGIFHPVLNLCGGGEAIALNIINSLRQNGHKVFVLTNEKINQTKFVRTFGQKLHVDGEIVFPLQFFRNGDLHNVYADAIRCLTLKSKCKIVIDTFSNAILPGTDVVYIHFPFFKHLTTPVKITSRLKNTMYYLPYRTYEKKIRKNVGRIIFANSKFTSNAIKETVGIRAFLLYPPISPFFLEKGESVLSHQRSNNIVTVSRIAPEKNLDIIPYIAKITHEAMFLIIGNQQNEEVLSKLSKLIQKLHVADKVVILTNISIERLREILGSSKVYFHSAVNEHFGISIVEAMACGCIPVVHDSGGPREFLPSHLRYKSIEEAATKIKNAISEWSPEKGRKMLDIASRFSERNFSEKFINRLTYLKLLPRDKNS